MSRRRSPATAGAIGMLVILLAAVSAMALDSLPLIGAGPTYHAEFSEAAGLAPGNEVRIAGVKVGKVSALELDGGHVDVAFKVSDAWIGDETSASIQIKTIMGTKYLALDPRGTDVLKPGDAIPLDRTTSPYDVIDAFSSAARTVGAIDGDQLAGAMTSLSQAFEGTPAEIRASLDGVSRLSGAVASRDQELRRLFDTTANTSKVLADRNAQFTRLIADAGVLLDELNHRQQAISQLLTGTQRLSQKLSGLVKDNEAIIGPALQQLGAVVKILREHNENLDKSVKLYEPFTRLYTNIVGNGRWFEAAFVNLLPPALPDVPGPREPVRALPGN
ncbi:MULTISPECIES: MCE family protein [Rhodococcus]|uniref:MCE family protein n=1 Tax=Rhodococcus oxybenzonivorans TaxID=1990687 RepID=A0AAE4UVR1_9NOCA|nr:MULTISPECIES: MCE family protein [Rhodococcus]MDV7244339.1 MCE family protein [Rhodococcus oxybenzonivorans]MDV7263502.1 MCE family protein [Rhodococcus oxybenzonivorans]MDV7274418.1 MCE family protein [Rhodococcus oxybenzonivorans]MDV7335731.1 MCE family protein [Rhodococcus oxybenzonivorans]MDV7345368.1 MCE family protein [Rhodococcus oxybenzonivorans]